MTYQLQIKKTVPHHGVIWFNVGTFSVQPGIGINETKAKEAALAAYQDAKVRDPLSKYRVIAKVVLKADK